MSDCEKSFQLCLSYHLCCVFKECTDAPGRITILARYPDWSFIVLECERTEAAASDCPVSSVVILESEPKKFHEQKVVGGVSWIDGGEARCAEELVSCARDKCARLGAPVTVRVRPISTRSSAESREALRRTLRNIFACTDVQLQTGGGNLVV